MTDDDYLNPEYAYMEEAQAALSAAEYDGVSGLIILWVIGEIELPGLAGERWFQINDEVFYAWEHWRDFANVLSAVRRMEAMAG